MDQFRMTPYEHEQEQYKSLREYEAQQKKNIPSGMAAKVQGQASFVARWGVAIVAMVVSFFAFNLIIQLIIGPHLSPGSNLGGVLTIVLGIIAPICILFAVKNAVKKKQSSNTQASHQRVEEAIAVRRHEVEQDVREYRRKYDAWQAQLRAKGR